MRAALALVLVAAALLATGCGGGGKKAAATGCPVVTAPKPRKPDASAGRPQPLATGKTWTLTFRTSCGTFVVALDRTGPGDDDHRLGFALRSAVLAGEIRDRFRTHLLPT